MSVSEERYNYCYNWETSTSLSTYIQLGPQIVVIQSLKEEQCLTALVLVPSKGRRFGIFQSFSRKSCWCCRKAGSSMLKTTGPDTVHMTLGSSRLVCIIASEYICQPLQHDAALDEVVGDLPPALSVELPNEDVVKLIRQPVPETLRGLA